MPQPGIFPSAMCIFVICTLFTGFAQRRESASLGQDKGALWPLPWHWLWPWSPKFLAPDTFTCAGENLCSLRSFSTAITNITCSCNHLPLPVKLIAKSLIASNTHEHTPLPYHLLPCQKMFCQRYWLYASIKVNCMKSLGYLHTHDSQHLIV